MSGTVNEKPTEVFLVWSESYGGANSWHGGEVVGCER